MGDKAAAVRTAATSVLASMLSQLHSLQHPILATSLASDLVESLGRSPHWAKRQTHCIMWGVGVAGYGIFSITFQLGTSSAFIRSYLGQGSKCETGGCKGCLFAPVQVS